MCPFTRNSAIAPQDPPFHRRSTGRSLRSTTVRHDGKSVRKARRRKFTPPHILNKLQRLSSYRCVLSSSPFVRRCDEISCSFVPSLWRRRASSVRQHPISAVSDFARERRRRQKKSWAPYEGGKWRGIGLQLLAPRSAQGNWSLVPPVRSSRGFCVSAVAPPPRRLDGPRAVVHVDAC